MDLSDSRHIVPDLYLEENRIVYEIFAYIGLLKASQKHKISQDILELLLL